MEKKYDTVIIGGGFYGMRIAQFLVESLGQKKVLIIEKESDTMQRASYNNQARVHNGYHYPRSVLTALRSRVNLPIFSKEYEDAIVTDFDKYYGIAKTFSKVSAKQFQRFFERIEAEVTPAPEAMQYFDKRLIEEVFLVKEYAFNSKKIRESLINRLSRLDVDINTKEEVKTINKTNNGIRVITDKANYETNFVLNTGYSSINVINKASKLPVLPLKHELTEMCLVTMPPRLANKAFTIMCGPFFSLMPFPDKNSYTMSHVRYTPHQEWRDEDGVKNLDKMFDKKKITSKFPLMHADIKRYMPDAANITYNDESLWEFKTVLTASEDDDSRPILYKADYGGIKNYVCIMGGKIDNIYDVFRELEGTYGQSI